MIKTRDINVSLTKTEWEELERLVYERYHDSSCDFDVLVSCLIVDLLAENRV